MKRPVNIDKAILCLLFGQKSILHAELRVIADWKRRIFKILTAELAIPRRILHDA
jgi:hypothetical protein